MYPTLQNGEQILAEKVSLKMSKPTRGEILVIKHPQDPNRLLIKRLVALPGETLMLKDGQVYINDELLPEPYLQNGINTFAGRVIEENTKYLIPEHEYIFMGDNRTKSSDSRDFNTIREENIVGHALAVYYPFKSMRTIKSF
jgi:signal peptidase I